MEGEPAAKEKRGGRGRTKGKLFTLYWLGTMGTVALPIKTQNETPRKITRCGPLGSVGDGVFEKESLYG